MNKRIRIISIIVLAIILVILGNTAVYADPNGGGGFASFSDEDAEKQNKELIEDQKNENNITEVKSSDNYLAELEVEGYSLTPEFNYQTLDYSIDKEITQESINIKATPSSSKAKVDGAGLINLSTEQDSYRIDVTSETGTVRTYTIKINYKKSEQPENTSQTNVVEPENTVKEENKVNINEVVNTVATPNTPQDQPQNSKINKPAVIIIILIILFLIVFIIKKVNKKSKH